jgi:RNA polymerase sigma factor (sigma-70 family)
MGQPEGVMHLTPELKAQIRAALETLSEDERDLFWDWAVDGYTQRELAERMDVSYRTVKRRIRRIREKLKNVINLG